MGKNVEIELKLHVEDPQDCRKRLEALAGTGTAFFKDDAYWFPLYGGKSPSSADDGLSSSGLRVRREEREGTSRIILTFKTKEKREGIEINDEKELETSGDSGVLEELLRRIQL
jgi:adenylate cyclase class IV